MLESPLILSDEPISAYQKGAYIRLQHVKKTFDGKQVLKRLDLQVQPGEFIAVVGRSGSGKSTLLRLVAGLEHPTSGNVSLDGEEVRGIHHETTVMFQDARLLPWKSVIDNVGIGLKGDWLKRAEWSLAQVDLADRKQEWPSVLSGGQRQRVALARALIRSPKLLLLDEPLSALDALTRLEMQQLIEKLWLEQKFTTLLVTHDVSEAVRLADRIILLEAGGIAMDLYNRIPRPRRHTDPQFASLEKEVLDQIMHRHKSFSI
ncbi:ATP-binding cassette domain-containing protein [Aneurinibacillus migulanus]|uniref:ATP-binding cassette domain-containing protein n=1 Tax=Aneurinibacillus migulanus TaxID=47500 RepID=UPI000FADEEA1|nr:ATP-binding cassette domain-containing protein [Aneurinibacillus migulanus]MCP1354452.1 ATP-binding cassette domain-containing protein [Aneurinibacillus migulanus]